MERLSVFSRQKSGKKLKIDDIRLVLAVLLKMAVKDPHVFAGRAQVFFLALSDQGDLLERQLVAVKVLEHLRGIPDDLSDLTEMHVRNSQRKALVAVPDVNAHFDKRIDRTSFGKRVGPLTRAKSDRVVVFDIAALFIFTTPGIGQIRQPVKWTVSTQKVKKNVYEVKAEGRIRSGWHIYDLQEYKGGPNPTVFSVSGEGIETVGEARISSEISRHFDEVFGMAIGTCEKILKYETN